MANIITSYLFKFKLYYYYLDYYHYHYYFIFLNLSKEVNVIIINFIIKTHILSQLHKYLYRFLQQHYICLKKFEYLQNILVNQQ